MEMLSSYYANYIKGAYYSKSKSTIQIHLAIEWLNKALEAKQTEEACHSLLICYFKLNDSDKYEQVLLEAVDNGFEAFYTTCGIFYANNKEKFDEGKALYWFQKGIDLKDARCCSELAKLYISGCKAFKPDRTKSIDLLKKGLELNNPKWNGYFACMLGLAYYEDKKYDEAYELYKKALDYNYQQANYYLALMYRDGVGVEKDSQKYLELLMKYLFVDSALEIAGVFLLNQIVKEDKEVAYIFLDYAAREGNAVGAILSAAYLVERGKYDEKLLNQYLEIAFRNGVTDQNMKDHYDEIEDAFNEEVRNKLQELASKYWNLSRRKA